MDPRENGNRFRDGAGGNWEDDASTNVGDMMSMLTRSFKKMYIEWTKTSQNALHGRAELPSTFPKVRASSLAGLSTAVKLQRDLQAIDSQTPSLLGEMGKDKPPRHVAVAIIYDPSTRQVLMITSRKHPHLWICEVDGLRPRSS